ncbi:MAG: hypothetical protein ACFFG0_24535 [Candidatus Thorarchaeota archaeon]
MDAKQKILDLIKIKGPVIPSNISKEINQDLLMASAHLSELSSAGKLKISSLKIGGTPLYYLPEQQHMLQNFSDNLHEKEKKAFDLLKEKKVLRDREQEPVIRVALREIKDFAVPLQVTYQNNKELFWKWSLLSNEETQTIIKSLLEQKISEKKEETKDKKIIEEPKIPEKKKEESEQQQKIIEKEPEPKEKIVEGLKKKPENKQQKKQPKDNFFEDLNEHFNKNNIVIKTKEIIRKNSEIDFILEIPSKIGNLEYYCKSKNKKRVSESDLSSAYVQGQIKKLPVLFLMKGELTKKAKEMLNQEFKNITINKI